MNDKFLWFNDFNKNNTGIIRNKGVNGGAIYNISKRG